MSSSDPLVITYNPAEGTTVILSGDVETYRGPEPLGIEGACITARMSVLLGRVSVSVRRVRGQA